LTNNTLSKISLPIKSELNQFNDLYGKSLKSKVGLVDLVTKYILKQKGKKIRPLLVLLSSQMAGGINDRSYRGAILVELLHSATLVHDDVVDNAEKRRGLPSINAIWKNKIAVLMGDYLLAKGLMLAVDKEDFDFLKIVTDTVRRMSEGELLQIKKTRKLDIDEETYFRIINDKTASLLSTCCEIGAAAVTTNETDRKKLREFGTNLGIAFQIKDDILDYVGAKSLIGKPIGGDIKERKITLPLLYSLKKADPSESKNIIKLLKSNNRKERVSEVIDFVKKYDGINYSERIARDYAEKAKSCISDFTESEAKKSLLQLVNFVVDRNK
jgi:octaprenyl-diphosphate synthase